ncbi:hypothetical protein ABIE26_001702 [Pedobacter africanus]|uniref:Uncharacterized protein n=1 Tax=Pedobacter africanus TaxID=151894 RepID=A0ACC6KR42_9SPHI|nr:hypothetical protein [Pedobacter africanus]MDR6781810.1 hypothetical protein [Pedobacter africanus]
MKRLVLTGLLGLLVWLPYQASAQVSISVNIGSQPAWGPRGYDYVDYYYLPDIECYYHVPKRQFIYMEGNRWRYSRSLPSRWRGYDLYHGRTVVVNSRNAYRDFDRHRVIYSGHGHGKKYYSRDYDRDDHNWGGRDRGRDREHDRGRGHGHGRGKH